MKILDELYDSISNRFDEWDCYWYGEEYNTSGDFWRFVHKHKNVTIDYDKYHPTDNSKNGEKWVGVTLNGTIVIEEDVLNNKSDISKLYKLANKAVKMFNIVQKEKDEQERLEKLESMENIKQQIANISINDLEDRHTTSTDLHINKSERDAPWMQNLYKFWKNK